MKIRHVTKSVSGGNEYYYFRRNKGARIPLPPPDHARFMDAYNEAMAGQAAAFAREMPITPLTLRKQRTEATLRQALKSARRRATARGLDFDLTLDWALDKVEASECRCELTEIEFFADHGSKGVKNPFTPSLDRIDPARGYTKDNVRIVVFAINAMLLDWGEDVFSLVANRYRNIRRREFKALLSPTGLGIPQNKTKNKENQQDAQ